MRRSELASAGSRRLHARRPSARRSPEVSANSSKAPFLSAREAGLGLANRQRLPESLPMAGIGQTLRQFRRKDALLASLAKILAARNSRAMRNVAWVGTADSAFLFQSDFRIRLFQALNQALPDLRIQPRRLLAHPLRLLACLFDLGEFRALLHRAGDVAALRARSVWRLRQPRGSRSGTFLHNRPSPCRLPSIKQCKEHDHPG